MSTDDQQTGLRWLPPNDARNPFTFEVIDCRSIALNMTSATTDPQVVANFFGLRKSDASEVAAHGPSEPIVVNAGFSIAYAKPLTDGPLFLAPAMEHKWDIYARDGRLYARRSWTGNVVHVAEVEQLTTGGLSFRSLTCEASSVFGSREFAVAQLHFLLSTYLEGRLRPFPIPPPQDQDDAETIAWGGWSFYGPAAQFACRLQAYRQESLGRE